MTGPQIRSMLNADIEQMFYIRVLLPFRAARPPEPPAIKNGGPSKIKKNGNPRQNPPEGRSQIEAQRSGFDLERSRSRMSER